MAAPRVADVALESCVLGTGRGKCPGGPSGPAGPYPVALAGVMGGIEVEFQ